MRSRAAFGLYVEVHAATGARSVADRAARCRRSARWQGAEADGAVAAEGQNRRTRTRKPVPIAPSLAMRLEAGRSGTRCQRAAAADEGRQALELAPSPNLFIEAAKAGPLPDGASIYCLRHTAITRALLAGVPVRLVAASFDTSVAMIEKTYSSLSPIHGDAQMRRAMFDADAPAAGNVVPLVR